MTYRHLTADERTRIDSYLQAGVVVQRIAEFMKRHVSTVYRELARNRKGRKAYEADAAQGMAMRRAALANSRPRIHERVYRHARRYLTRLDMSPAQIARRLAISHETLYQWIYRQIAGGYAWASHLRTGRPCRYRRKALRAAIAKRSKAAPISERCEAARQRQEFGHWEADLLMGRKDCSAAVLVVKERQSRLTLLAKVPRYDSQTVMRCLSRLLKPFRDHMKTLTTDNGSEFIQHERFVQTTGCRMYVCDPHSPWQRGQVEGENKNIRQYLPKSFNVDRLDPRRLATIERKLNLRPKLVIGDRCPLAVAIRLSGVALRY
jgi:transposase, IS30 family